MKRRELKLVHDRRHIYQILDRLSSSTSMRKHHSSQFVNSLYFDDLWLNDALDNLAGLSERKKIRLRWYAQNNSIKDCPSHINLEIKRKKSFLSYKEVFGVNNLSLDNHVSYKQLTNYMVETTNNNKIITPLLRPTLQVQYLREYYIINSKIRITIDNNIRFFDAITTNKPKETDCQNFDQSVLEIKFDPKLYPYVASILNNLKLSPARNSKYLRGLSSFGYIKYF